MSGSVVVQLKKGVVSVVLLLFEGATSAGVDGGLLTTVVFVEFISTPPLFPSKGTILHAHASFFA